MADDSAKSSDAETSDHDFDERQVIIMRLMATGKEVGCIIGRKGENVKAIRKESGASVNISDGSNVERIVTVRGNGKQIVIAFSLISAKLEESGTTDVEEGVLLRVIMPNSYCGSLIGRNGVNIKKLREKSGARIIVANEMLPESTERIVDLSGQTSSVINALKRLVAIAVETKPKAPYIPYNPNFEEDYYPPADQYGNHVPGFPGSAGIPGLFDLPYLDSSYAAQSSTNRGVGGGFSGRSKNNFAVGDYYDGSKNRNDYFGGGGGGGNSKNNRGGNPGGNYGNAKNSYYYSGMGRDKSDYQRMGNNNNNNNNNRDHYVPSLSNSNNNNNINNGYYDFETASSSFFSGGTGQQQQQFDKSMVVGNHQGAGSGVRGSGLFYGGDVGGRYNPGDLMTGGFRSQQVTDLRQMMRLRQEGGYGRGGGLSTDEIIVPNELVGGIIGRKGSKINEIRENTGAMIKITEADDGTDNRLITISGPWANVQSAVYLITNLRNKAGGRKPHSKIWD